jgi:hypothetical protein
MNQRYSIALMSALLLAGTASAQYGPGRGRDYSSPSGRRGGDIARVVRDLDERTSVFERSFRHALERSDYRGSYRQDELVRHANALDQSVSRVRESWNRGHNVEKTRHFVDEAIHASRSINSVMNRNRFYPGLQEQWSAVRGELNRLAEAFGLPRLRWE